MGSVTDSSLSFEKQRQAWLDKRRNTVGGSEAAVLFGVHPWVSAYSLWAERTGHTTRKEPGEAAEWGNILEPVIAEQYAVRTGRQLKDLGMFTLLHNPQYPFAHATLDRMILGVDSNGGDGVFEAKNVGSRMSQHWVEGAPEYCQIQLQHNLMVAGLGWGAIAALLNGNTFFLGADTEINPDLVSEIAEREARFMDCVRNRIPPKPLDGSDATRNTLQALFPRSVQRRIVVLPPASAQWDAELVNVKKTIQPLTQQKRTLENCLREAIGDAEVGKIPNQDVEYTLKEITKKEHTVKESHYRDLRRKVPKKGGNH